MRDAANLMQKTAPGAPHYLHWGAVVRTLLFLLTLFVLVGGLATSRRGCDVCMLTSAAAVGDDERILAALDAGVDPDADDGRAMLLAAGNGGGHSVEVLLSHGANPSRVNFVGYTPLRAAAARGDRQSLLALLRAGADPDEISQLPQTPLGLALQFGHEQAAEILLAHGASAKGKFDAHASRFEPPLISAAHATISLSLLQRLIDEGA